MTGPHFNPFANEPSAVTGSELAILKTVEEGWFVDYKGECPAIEKLAKHISAFANQRGGWLFIGIDEDRQTRRAGSFRGIPISELALILDRVRNAVNQYVSPSLHYSVHTIHGPCAEIGLEAARVILVVSVPEGSNPPYIHKSGRIYRREGDSSEPKAENDRIVLDEMWRKTERANARLLRFFDEAPKRASQGGQTLISHFFILHDPFFVEPPRSIGRKRFVELVTATTTNDLSLSLDMVQPTLDGFYAKAVQSNNPLSSLPSLRWWNGGNFRLSVPMSPLIPVARQRSQLEDSFFESAQPATGGRFRPYDIGIWVALMSALLKIYARIRREAQIDGSAQTKLIIRETEGMTPYLELPSYVKAVTEGFLPVVEEQNIEIPSRTDDRIVQQVAIRADVDGDDSSWLAFVPELVLAVKAMGLPLSPPKDLSEAEERDVVVKFLKAVEKSIQKSMEPTKYYASKSALMG
ncbi:AlbA family DNA-binding domain-containing protein [Paludibaculum fermentans]|uniref:AlbA family DNA-binding domain-containing protein n=1 Tax=Paludibaculum fermentans TaxID=1473598 RepID=UPI003EB9602C